MLEHDFTTYNNFIIPAFLEPELIGTLLSSYNLENGKKLYVLLSTGDKVINLVQTTLANGYKQNRLSINKEGMLKVEIVDTQISADKFERVIVGHGKKFLYSLDGKRLAFSSSIYTGYVKGLAADGGIQCKLSTLDIEAMEVVHADGRVELVPYLITFVANITYVTTAISFYLGDFNSIDEMFEAFFKEILRRKYSGHIFHVHNLAGLATQVARY